MVDKPDRLSTKPSTSPMNAPSNSTPQKIDLDAPRTLTR
jgi:hypothetical protein